MGRFYRVHNWILTSLLVIMILSTISCVCIFKGKFWCQRDYFAVALLPDTQYYTKESPPTTYKKQTQWIVDNRYKENIKFAIHLGDITHENIAGQWTVADQAHDILDEAQMAYSVVPGNHDMPHEDRWKRNTDLYNEYFPISRFSEHADTWYGGHMGSGNENNFTFFEFGKLKFMVVSLEFAPTKDAICWANEIIQNHPRHRVIIVTHCYQGKGGDHQMNCATEYNIAGSGGHILWDELVSRHNNIFLVLCGHISDAEKNTRTGLAGNTVHEILTDYQSEDPGGNGWMRTLKFIPKENSIEVRSFSVIEGVTTLNHSDYSHDPNHTDHAFTLTYDMTSPMPDYIYAEPENAFNDRTVNSDDSRQQRRPAVAMARNGDFVVVWEDDSKGVENVYQIYARGFYAGGCEKFHDITVNADSRGQQLRPDVAMAENRSFVVVWEDDRNENDTFQIYAAGFDADGNKTFGDITVNSNSAGQQLKPAVAMAPNGSFVVVWEDDSRGDQNVYQIYAAGFDAGGRKTFGDITVNAASDGQQLKPDVAMADNGSFVVVWEDDSRGAQNVYQIYAAGFDAGGRKTFGDITVNSNSDRQQLKPAVAMTSNGSFVVVWEDDSGGAQSVYQIYAAGFNSLGHKTFGDITVNSESAGQQLKPDVALGADGSFVVVWEDDKDGNDTFQIYVTGFSATGSKIFPDATVNTDATGQQLKPAVAMNRDGSFVVVWEDDMDKNTYYQILARGFDGP